jgi:hypothetical protein
LQKKKYHGQVLGGRVLDLALELSVEVIQMGQIDFQKVVLLQHIQSKLVAYIFHEQSLYFLQETIHS